MVEKICTKCKENKNIIEFSIRKDRPSGYLSACKECIKKDQLLFREKNREKLKNYAKNYYSINREESLLKRKEYLEKNKEAVRESHKKWRINNSNYLKEKNKLYYNDNKLQITEQKRNYAKNKRYNDPFYLMKLQLRHRNYVIFKNKSFKKYKTTSELLGCEFQTAYNHIESKFKEGMSWNNRSEWHIDHIIPLSSATTQEELIKLCHYTNLQPLWSKDNLQKSNKIIDYEN